MEEKYYWTNEKGEKIPKDELSDLHICNIVMKFGKDDLIFSGHKVIVNKFEKLNKKYKFFECVAKEKFMGKEELFTEFDNNLDDLIASFRECMPEDMVNSDNFECLCMIFNDFQKANKKIVEDYLNKDNDK